MKKKLSLVLLTVFLITAMAMPLAAADREPFTDVSADDWYGEVVADVYEKGLMTGITDELFAPEQTTTRAMALAIIHRHAGQPAAMPWKYTDMQHDAWYAQAANWAGANGIVSNDYDGMLRPNDDITREEFATMLYNYEQYKNGKVVSDRDISTFGDADKVSDWAEAAVKWAVENGIMAGRGDNNLAPEDTAKRAEMASMVMRYLNA